MIGSPWICPKCQNLKAAETFRRLSSEYSHLSEILPPLCLQGKPSVLLLSYHYSGDWLDCIRRFDRVSQATEQLWQRFSTICKGSTPLSPKRSLRWSGATEAISMSCLMLVIWIALIAPIARDCLPAGLLQENTDLFLTHRSSEYTRICTINSE